MDRTELLTDKDKLLREYQAQQRIVQQGQMQMLRLEGAIAYIEGNLKESEDDRQESDRA